MPVPLLPVVAIGVLAAGSAIAAWRLTRTPPLGPAPEGAPQLDARLPVSLWPPLGGEPVVRDDPQGWGVLLAHLAHPSTRPDGAERARAVAFAGHRRSELEARRAVALEAHLLRGRYDPDLIAAAWLYPLRPASAEASHALRAFGVPAEAVAIVEAAHDLDLDDVRVSVARRRLGVDPLAPEFGDSAFDDLDPTDRPLLAALLLDAAAARIAARVRR